MSAAGSFRSDGGTGGLMPGRVWLRIALAPGLTLVDDPLAQSAAIERRAAQSHSTLTPCRMRPSEMCSPPRRCRSLALTNRAAGTPPVASMGPLRGGTICGWLLNSVSPSLGKGDRAEGVVEGDTAREPRAARPSPLPRDRAMGRPSERQRIVRGTICSEGSARGGLFFFARVSSNPNQPASRWLVSLPRT